MFDINGSFLNEDWFLRNRMDDRETDPTKIMMLMPADWATKARAIRNVVERDLRKKLRSDSQRQAESMLPKPKIPDIGTGKENSSNFDTVDLYSPLSCQDKEKDEEFYVATEVNLQGYNNPANQGTLSYQESFGNCPISE